MTLSLWMLLAFAGWTLLVLLTGVGVYRWSLIFTGRAELTSFPGDTPHGQTAMRASGISPQRQQRVECACGQDYHSALHGG